MTEERKEGRNELANKWMSKKWMKEQRREGIPRKEAWNWNKVTNGGNDRRKEGREGGRKARRKGKEQQRKKGIKETKKEKRKRKWKKNEGQKTKQNMMNLRAVKIINGEREPERKNKRKEGRKKR